VKGLELPLADGLRLEGDLSTLLRTTEDRVEGAKASGEARAALAGDIALPSLYARLSRAQQAIYRKSDAITEIRLLQAERFPGAVTRWNRRWLAGTARPPGRPASG